MGTMRTACKIVNAEGLFCGVTIHSSFLSNRCATADRSALQRALEPVTTINRCSGIPNRYLRGL
ncbi:hypothetical protein SCLCIDRAFT_1219067 [Scleroderma citrinum Foug A]|uniref:Uncharacterized protein n=1 Tax=Scleroderma citrinum Foug A TaxID=1036808 RepID=A0A0C3DAP8_9AGAM|nr:hypothetical protein SCLCIDRAFT_1219067 [Scleroderma citrinum Foug A]